MRVDPMKMNFDGLAASQLEEIVEGWKKLISKAFRDGSEKVNVY